MNVSDPSSGGGQDFDINLAPIIDCFTVLITFLLASASFLAVGVLDTEKVTEGASSSSSQTPQIRLEVELQQDHSLRVKVSGQGEMEKTLPPKDKEWDLVAFDTQLGEIKQKWPAVPNLILSAADDVEYGNVIRVMEMARTRIPTVLLGGF